MLPNHHFHYWPNRTIISHHLVVRIHGFFRFAALGAKRWTTLVSKQFLLAKTWGPSTTGSRSEHQLSQTDGKVRSTMTNPKSVWLWVEIWKFINKLQIHSCGNNGKSVFDFLGGHSGPPINTATSWWVSQHVHRLPCKTGMIGAFHFFACYLLLLGND